MTVNEMIIALSQVRDAMRNAAKDDLLDPEVRGAPAGGPTVGFCSAFVDGDCVSLGMCGDGATDVNVGDGHVYCVMRQECGWPYSWSIEVHSTEQRAKSHARAYDVADEYGLYVPHEVNKWPVDPPLDDDTKLALSLKAFRESGEDVACIGTAMQEHGYVGVPGRVYANRSLWIERRDDETWYTLGGGEDCVGELEDCERFLCKFALEEGWSFPYVK